MSWRGFGPGSKRWPPQYSIPAETQFAIQLCLEEALSNIIRHGYRDQPNQPITVDCATTRRLPQELVFTIEDQAPPFDPLAPSASRIARSHLHRSAAARRPGNPPHAEIRRQPRLPAPPRRQPPDHRLRPRPPADSLGLCFSSPWTLARCTHPLRYHCVYKVCAAGFPLRPSRWCVCPDSFSVLSLRSPW